ncbi:MAG TPA: hypothetical protein VFT06_16175 [Flavisolibacter sp.]|jgi:hypothetical protein|nr:hypothetical protein [Flavisolibacter sp.]
MKSITLFLLVLFSFSSGCDLRQREDELQKREAALNQKEQELLLREKTLQQKETDLAKREQFFDSTSKDTARLVNTALTGEWDVQMSCTETTCAGSAVGDTKNERWDISYTANTLVAKAKTNDQLARVYTGFYTGSNVELTNNGLPSDTLAKTKMTVRLQTIDDTHMEGQREIVRNNDCRIVYAVKMQKL